VVVETAEDAPVVEEASEEEAPVEEVETEEAEVTTDDTKINYDAVKALVLDLAAQFNRVEEKLINKYNELETTVTEKLEKAVTEETLTEKLNEVQTLKKELAEAQGTLEKVISATAMSQSEDEDRNETVIEKSNDEDTNSGIFEKGLFTSGFNLA
jgi:glutathionylspermidine synthase